MEKELTIQDKLYNNVYICMKCNARIKTSKPQSTRCRKCGSSKLRLRKKPAKK